MLCAGRAELVDLAEGEGHSLAVWPSAVGRRRRAQRLRGNAHVRLGKVPQRRRCRCCRGGICVRLLLQMQLQVLLVLQLLQLQLLLLLLLVLLGAIVIVLVDGVEALEAAAGAEQELGAGLYL